MQPFRFNKKQNRCQIETEQFSNSKKQYIFLYIVLALTSRLTFIYLKRRT